MAVARNLTVALLAQLEVIDHEANGLPFVSVGAPHAVLKVDAGGLDLCITKSCVFNFALNLFVANLFAGVVSVETIYQQVVDAVKIN